jgi:hypothetical protein
MAGIHRAALKYRRYGVKWRFETNMRDFSCGVEPDAESLVNIIMIRENREQIWL